MSALNLLLNFLIILCTLASLFILLVFLYKKALLHNLNSKDFIPLNLQLLPLTDKTLIMFEIDLDWFVFNTKYPFLSMIILLEICNKRFINCNKITSFSTHIENPTLKHPFCSDTTYKFPLPSIKPTNQSIETKDLIIS